MEQQKRMPALTVENLCFSFDNGKHLFFKDITFSLQKGKIHILRGNNGIGKSTLFRLLAGTLYPQEKINCSMNWKIRVVTQDVTSMLASELTVEQNLRCANLPEHPGLGALPNYQEFSELLAHANIDLQTPVNLLSGGQKQILAILMTLQNDAPVLLLDEPTAALDSRNTTLVLNFLQELATTTDHAILIITHDKELATTYAPEEYFELYEQSDGTRTLRTVKR